MTGPILKSYRDLIVWQKAISLGKKIYTVTRNFPKEEIYGMTQQARRAAVSVAANIAEGQARNGRPEFIHFLGIAYGSLAELETYLILAEHLEFIQSSTLTDLIQDCEEVGRLLNGLLKSLRSIKSLPLTTDH
jgi:four helix bundle protein